MELIFKSGEKEIFCLNIEDSLYSDIILGTGKVKEISIVHNIQNSDEYTLDNIYEKIKDLKNYDINTVIVYYDKEHYFNFYFPLKDIYYRTLDYMREQNILFQENLSIRFEEDNEILLQDLNGHMICDEKHCKYFTKEKCNKYNKILKKYHYSYEVCENCALEMWSTTKFGKLFINKLWEEYK